MIGSTLDSVETDEISVSGEEKEGGEVKKDDSQSIKNSFRQGKFGPESPGWFGC